jgi:hypothetical protein
VLAVFRRLQVEQPSLFGQATLKRIWGGKVGFAAGPELDLTARVGAFASVGDLQAAADIRCLGFSGLKQFFGSSFVAPISWR